MSAWDSSNRKRIRRPITDTLPAEPAAVHTTFITDGNQFAADTGAVSEWFFAFL